MYAPLSSHDHPFSRCCSLLSSLYYFIVIFISQLQLIVKYNQHVSINPQVASSRAVGPKVTLKARRSRRSPGEWSAEFLRCPAAASWRSPGATRQRQKERLHWRAATWINDDVINMRIDINNNTTHTHVCIYIYISHKKYILSNIENIVCIVYYIIYSIQ
jgi:hypothetical protein